MAFAAPIDIINRALQLVGSTRRALTDNNKNISEALFAYDKIRLAALRRNLWTFSTRRVILRPIDVDTLLWTPPTWSATTWSMGAVASYAPTSGPYLNETIYWQTSAAKTGSNTTTPDLDADWHRYFGPVAIDLYDKSIVYNSGEIVVMPAVWSGATTYAANAVATGSDNAIYVSLVGSNLNNNPVGDTTHWTAWTSSGRAKGGWGVTAGGTFIPLTYPGQNRFYLSLIGSNADNPLATGAQWLSLTGSSVPLQLAYPIGAGPASQSQTANAYRLPYGYLREAPDDPKSNNVPFLGFPRGMYLHDWLREGNYIVSRETGPLMVRFVANLVDVTDMDPMFCEGVACQIALDGLVETLTNAPEKRGEVQAAFARVMSDARQANAIEMGPVDLPVDEYITCRR